MMPISQSIDTTMQEDPDWWALYTRHQHEKAVAEMLSAKGFEVFLPLYDSQRRWKDRKMTISLPLFPCYLFVRGRTRSPAAGLDDSRGPHDSV